MTTALAFVADGVVTKYPVSASDIRKKFPNTSFPSPITNADLTSFGVVSVTLQDRPSVTETQRLVAGQPVLSNGSWTQGWTVEDFSAEEIQELQDQEAAAAREQRDGLLAASDWTQVADAPGDTAAWATYRQALRDLPASAGWPSNITWPTQP